jgi:hypothetical protein
VILTETRQYRHLDFISQFTTDIRHISGKNNVVADTLSRIEELQMLIDLDLLATSQTTDEELSYFLSGETSLRLQKMKIPNSHNEVYCDTTTLLLPNLSEERYLTAFTASATQAPTLLQS